MTRPDPMPLLDPAHDATAPFFSMFGERLMDLLIREPGWDLLDVATGHGSVASAAVARGFTVTATDSAPRLVANLRLQNRGINALLMNAHSLDFEDDSFDIATASFVIDLFDDAQQVLQEVCRVVRPGGLVAVTVPAETGSGTSAPPAEIGSAPGIAPVASPVHVAEILAQAGLSDLRQESIEVRLPVDSRQRFMHHLARVHLGRVPGVTMQRGLEASCRA